MRNHKLVAIVALTAIGWATGWATAEIVSFQQGADNAFVTNYQGTSDNMIIQTYANGNNGGYPNFGAGNVPWANVSNPFRGLLRFDLSSFAGQYRTIHSISLKVFNDSSVGDLQVEFYRLLPANAAWVQGTRTDNGTQTGSSCWNYLAYNTADWAGTRGAGTAGTDYDATPLATFHSRGYQYADGYQADPRVYGTNTIALGGGSLTLTQVIDQWAGNQAANAGILLRAYEVDENTKGDRFVVGSAERVAVAERPMLIVDYTPIPEPATLALLGLGGLVVLGSRRRRRELS